MMAEDAVPVEGPFVEVERIPPSSRGRALTRTAIVVGNLLSLVPLILLLGGLGAIAGGAVLLGVSEGGGLDRSSALAGAVALFVVGALCAVAGAVIGLAKVSFLGDRYLQSRVRRLLDLRPGKIVDPREPDAAFIEVVPRDNWQRLMLETASDIGFLQVDEGRRQVRFEGDAERWLIPAGALVSCDVEQLILPGGQGMKLFLVALRAYHPEGIWERPVALRGGTGLLDAGRRWRQTAELRRRIEALMQ